MKRKLVVAALFGVLGLAAFAGTCTVTNWTVTRHGDQAIFGAELQNDSGANILQHKFVVAFVDDGGAVIDTEVVEGCLRSLPNGGSDFFSAVSDEDESDVDNALGRLALDSSLKYGDAAEGDITISDLRVRRQGETLRVTGTVTNNDNDDLDDPNVCAVVFNNDGEVVIVAKDKELTDPLEEDQSDDFLINIDVPDNVNDVDTVSVYVDGLEDGVPVEPEADTDNAVTECEAPTNTPTGTPPAATNTPTTPVATPTPCF